MIDQGQTTPDVSITENAADQLKSLLAREEVGKNFRVYVESGGCSGLQYGMVFDEKRQDDLTLEYHGVSVSYYYH